MVANDGPAPVSLTGLAITDYTRTQQHVHVYRFPPARGGANLVLGVNGQAFVFTGHGTDERLTDGACFSSPAARRRSGTTPATSPTYAAATARSSTR